MILYYSKGACSLSTHAIIHELGLDCQFVAVNLADKKTADGEDFFTINPKGAVPTLKLDNGDLLTENIAIQQYLAETHGGEKLLPKLGHFKRYRVLEWLSFASSDLHKSFGPLFNKDVSEEAKRDIFIPILERRLNVLNNQLAGHDYITGDTFTLPDAYIFVTLRWLAIFKISLDKWKHVADFFERVKERPAMKKAMQEEGII